MKKRTYRFFFLCGISIKADKFNLYKRNTVLQDILCFIQDIERNISNVYQYTSIMDHRENHSIREFPVSCMETVGSLFCHDQWRSMAPKDLDKAIDAVARLIVLVSLLFFLKSCSEGSERKGEKERVVTCWNAPTSMRRVHNDKRMWSGINRTRRKNVFRENSMILLMLLVIGVLCPFFYTQKI